MSSGSHEGPTIPEQSACYEVKSSLHGLLLALPRLPLVEQAADVAVAEVLVGQLLGQLDGVPQLGIAGAALGQQEQDLLAAVLLARRQVAQRVLEVAAGQLPVVARLEAV